jgi:hypothetical protein
VVDLTVGAREVAHLVWIEINPDRESTGASTDDWIGVKKLTVVAAVILKRWD